LTSLPNNALVVKVWYITPFIGGTAPFVQYLRTQLPAGSVDLLISLAAALNDRATLPELEKIPRWREATPQPLE